MELIVLGILVLQIILLLWVIDTLGTIKVYLRDIRDIPKDLTGISNIRHYTQADGLKKCIRNCPSILHGLTKDYRAIGQLQDDRRGLVLIGFHAEYDLLLDQL